MRILSGKRRTYPTRSAAAKRAVSQQRARQRRRTQRSRQFNQRFASLESALGKRVQFPSPPWRRILGRARLPGFSGFAPSKIVSLALLIAVVGGVLWLHDDDRFFVYRDNVHFSGATFLQDEDLYRYCDVEAWSVLWLDPALIRQQVMAHPYVADAQVLVRWPADVRIIVTEVVPVALWSTEQGDFWLLADGAALPVPPGGARPALHILDPLAEAGAPGGQGAQFDPYLLETVLMLSKTVQISQFWYNRSNGLNFQLPGTKTWIYWGDGLQLDAKLQALGAARAEIRARPDEQRTLSLAAPNQPFFRTYTGPGTGPNR